MGLIYSLLVSLNEAFEEFSNAAFCSSFALSAPYWALFYA